MSEESGPSTMGAEKQTVDINSLVKGADKTIIRRIYVNNDNGNNPNKSRDNFISNRNVRNANNIQAQLRQPIIVKRNRAKLEKLQKFRKHLLELGEIVDLEINKTEVEWLSLTYQAEKLKNTQQEEHEDEMKKVTMEEIDEQLRNCAELPELDLRPTIPYIKQQQQTDDDEDEEFDSDEY